MAQDGHEGHDPHPVLGSGETPDELMFTGIGFLSLLTAAVASRFVKQERGAEHAELIEALQRIEADVAELKSRL